MNFGEIPPGALRAFSPGWISIHHLAGASTEKMSATMTEMSAATVAVMACNQAAESRLVIAAPAAAVSAWLSVGRDMVKFLGRSSPLPGAETPYGSDCWAPDSEHDFGVDFMVPLWRACVGLLATPR
jgi:hypothetical protein